MTRFFSQLSCTVLLTSYRFVSDGVNFEEQVPYTDEEMITCHVCLMRFNLTEQKPKSLDCKNK